MKIKVAFKQNKNIWVVNAEKFILNLGLWCLTPLSTIFSYIIAFSFIGGRNRSNLRKQPTRCKSLTNFIT
jgi:hypothetical protein